MGGEVGGELLGADVLLAGDVEVAVAVRLLVEVAHELSPAEELADEAFGAGEGDGAFGGGDSDVLDEGEGEHAAEIQVGGGFRMEELAVVVAHGVFVRAEVGEVVVEGELPGEVGVVLGTG